LIYIGLSKVSGFFSRAAAAATVPPGEDNTVNKSKLGYTYGQCRINWNKHREFGSPETGRGGATVPGSPRSELYAKSSKRPQPVEGLPTGSRPGMVTAEESEEEDRIVQLSIMDHCLKNNNSGAAAPISERHDSNDDNMSMSSVRHLSGRRKAG